MCKCIVSVFKISKVGNVKYKSIYYYEYMMERCENRFMDLWYWWLITKPEIKAYAWVDLITVISFVCMYVCVSVYI